MFQNQIWSWGGGIDKCKVAHHWGGPSATREGEVDFRLDAVNAIVVLLLRQLLVLQSHHQCLHHKQVNISKDSSVPGLR
jgi:hypothetical protein